MLLGLGHKCDESEINKLLTTPGDAAKLFTITFLQLIFKLMLKEKLLTLSKGSVQHTPIRLQKLYLPSLEGFGITFICFLNTCP